MSILLGHQNQNLPSRRRWVWRSWVKYVRHFACLESGTAVVNGDRHRQRIKLVIGHDIAIYEHERNFSENNESWPRADKLQGRLILKYWRWSMTRACKWLTWLGPMRIQIFTTDLPFWSLLIWETWPCAGIGRGQRLRPGRLLSTGWQVRLRSISLQRYRRSTVNRQISSRCFAWVM